MNFQPPANIDLKTPAMAMDVPPNFSRGGLAWELPTGAKPASARWTWGWVKLGTAQLTWPVS